MKSRYRWLRRMPVLLGAVLVLLIAALVYFLQDSFKKPPQTKKMVRQVTMIQPPPPPPPEQKPPEPEIEEEKIEPLPEEAEPEPEPEPSPEQDDKPPAEDLGLDAEGSAGADGFGLAARQGGRALLGGGGGNAAIWYGGQIVRHVEDAIRGLLADIPALNADYSVAVDIWIGPDGRISRGELAGGSGNSEVDRALRQALSRLRVSIGKPPPDHMPQPIRIRLESTL